MRKFKLPEGVTHFHDAEGKEHKPDDTGHVEVRATNTSAINALLAAGAKLVENVVETIVDAAVETAEADTEKPVKVSDGKKSGGK